MSSQVYVVKRCDNPNCPNAEDTPEGESQEVSTVEFWVYVSGRGRKTKPIKIELCDTCLDEQKALFSAMQHFDLNKDG